MVAIAIYGKGGIGKSTISANITAALSESGKKVLQIGCDPKHDSTRLLLDGRKMDTLLDYIKFTVPEQRKIEDVIAEGYRGCLCTECGGPEPGIGCAGRGIITALDFIFQSGLGNIERDITLYDVLGDVVCGGFAVPLRNEYAEVVYIVSSGEFMSIYAANNILRGICNYNPRKVGGIIFNSRGDPGEYDRIKIFSDVSGVPIIGSFDRSDLFRDAEQDGKTIIEKYPDSDIASRFRELATRMAEPTTCNPHPLTESELEKCVLGRSVVPAPKGRSHVKVAVTNNPKKKYLSRNVSMNETYYGCAFSGACTTCASIEGLHIILHSPTSCAQLTFQSISSTFGRYDGNRRIATFMDPDVVCTRIEDDDVIFGGKENLRRNLDSAIMCGKRDIAVITSCVSGIIGDDVVNVIEDAKRSNPGTRIIPITVDGCLTGDFVQGIIDSTICLIDGLFRNSEKTDSVNIIGTKPLALNTLDSVAFIRGILDELDIGVNCILPGCDSVSSIEHVGSAKMNLLLNPDVFSVQISTFLNEKFGMSTAPISVRPGICGTLSFVRQLSEFFGRSYDMCSLKSRLEREFEEIIADFRHIVEGKKAVVISASKDIDWAVEGMDMAGIVRSRTVIVDRSDYTNDFGAPNQFKDAIYVKDMDVDAEMKIIEEIGPDILISSVRLSDRIPNIILPLVPEPDPMEGAWFVRRIALSLLSSVSEGWRKDVVQS